MKKILFYTLGAFTLAMSSMVMTSCEPDYYTNEDPSPVQGGGNSLAINQEEIDLTGLIFSGNKLGDLYTFNGAKIDQTVVVDIMLPGGTTQDFSNDAKVVISVGSISSQKVYKSISGQGKISVSGLTEQSVNGVGLVKGRVTIEGKFKIDNSEEVHDVIGAFRTIY